MAANFFECPVVNLKKNYQRNQKRFKPGEEYFKLEGEELAIFKAKFNEDVEAALTNEDDLDKVTNCPPVQRNAKVLYLWTRRGILRHAKMLNTDNAWEVYFMLERAYLKLVEGEQPALEEPKTLTLNGASVWTIRQAARIFNVSKGKIQAALQTRTFSRGKDFLVTNIEQLRRLRAENGMWFRNALTLIYERGMMKLRARFAELPSLFEPPKQIPAELKSFGQMLKDRASTMIAGGMLLKELGTRLTTE